MSHINPEKEPPKKEMTKDVLVDLIAELDKERVVIKGGVKIKNGQSKKLTHDEIDRVNNQKEQSREDKQIGE